MHVQADKATAVAVADTAVVVVDDVKLAVVHERENRHVAECHDEHPVVNFVDTYDIDSNDDQ